jgi:spermidine synthase
LVNRFYTEEFFRHARAALSPGGLLALSLGGAEGYLTEELAHAHAAVRGALVAAFGGVAALPGHRTLLLARRGGPVGVDPRAMARRLTEREVATYHLDATAIVSRTLPFKVELYEERLAEFRGRTNTDLHPAAHLHASLMWIALTSPELARRLVRLAERLAGAGWAVALAGLLLTLLWGALRGRRAAGLAVFTAGLSGMGLEIVLLLAWQEVRGVVHHELGLVLTLFMVGLSGGAWAGRWATAAIPRWALSASLVGCAAMGPAAWGAVGLAVASPRLALALLLGCVTLVGLCTGAAYAPAAELLAERRGEEGGARAYGWDLLGGALGSLLAAWLLVPVLGIPGTCLLCGGLCLGCGATVWR